MNPLSLVLLAFFAYFFYSIGSTFLAFLTLAVAIIFALSSAKTEAAGGHPGPSASHAGGVQPIVIGGGQPAAAFPRKFEFRPNFPGDPDGDEWVSSRIGLWIVLFGRMVKKIFGSSDAKREPHH